MTCISLEFLVIVTSHTSPIKTTEVTCHMVVCELLSLPDWKALKLLPDVLSHINQNSELSTFYVSGNDFALHAATVYKCSYLDYLCKSCNYNNRLGYKVLEWFQNLDHIWCSTKKKMSSERGIHNSRFQNQQLCRPAPWINTF